MTNHEGAEPTTTQTATDDLYGAVFLTVEVLVDTDTILGGKDHDSLTAQVALSAVTDGPSLNALGDAVERAIRLQPDDMDRMVLKAAKPKVVAVDITPEQHRECVAVHVDNVRGLGVGPTLGAYLGGDPNAIPNARRLVDASADGADGAETAAVLSDLDSFELDSFIAEVEAILGIANQDNQPEGNQDAAA